MQIVGITTLSFKKVIALAAEKEYFISEKAYKVFNQFSGGIMKTLMILFSLIMFSVTSLMAEMKVIPVPYSYKGADFKGLLVFDDASMGKKPGVAMIPNWMGVTENAVTKAKLLAGDQYVFFIIDMYGVNSQPKNSKEAGKAAGYLRKNRDIMRDRVNHGLDVFLANAGKVPLDQTQLAAIGFCFGGGVALELVRSGRNIAGAVSFHGNLDTPNKMDAKKIQSKVLVLHGAEDPVVSKRELDGFKKEMTKANVDWQLVSFGGAVHSFTNPEANRAGRAQYHPVVAKRAFLMMHNFFDELF